MTAIEQGHAILIKGEAVNQYSSAVQHAQLIQFQEFPPTAVGYTFTRVQHKRGILGHRPDFRCDVSFHHKRMRPTIVLDYPYRKFVGQQLRVERIMVANRRDAAQQVTQGSPPQTGVSWNGLMRCDRRALVLLDVSGPLGRIAVQPSSEIRIQPELKMIVGVDQAWKQ